MFVHSVPDRTSDNFYYFFCCYCSMGTCWPGQETHTDMDIAIWARHHFIWAKIGQIHVSALFCCCQNEKAHMLSYYLRFRVTMKKTQAKRVCPSLMIKRICWLIMLTSWFLRILTLKLNVFILCLVWKDIHEVIDMSIFSRSVFLCCSVCSTEDTLAGYNTHKHNTHSGGGVYYI